MQIIAGLPHDPRQYVHQTLLQLCAQGRLRREGSRMLYRYFAAASAESNSSSAPAITARRRRPRESQRVPARGSAQVRLLTTGSISVVVDGLGILLTRDVADQVHGLVEQLLREMR